MNDMTIKTPKGGVVRLRPAPEHLVHRVGELLPMGLELLPASDGTRVFGIVMQRGSREMIALKQQTIDFSLDQANILTQIHTLLVAAAVANFATAALPGLLIPCPYFRIKKPDSIETGIAFFAGLPDYDTAQVDRRQHSAFDDDFGHGFSDTWAHFIAILKECSRERRLTLQRFIGLDVRPRSHLGSIEFGFLVVDGQIIAIKTHITPRDPTWALMNTFYGVEEVWHLPAIGLTVSEVR